jgi:hypothetical protein
VKTYTSYGFAIYFKSKDPEWFRKIGKFDKSKPVFAGVRVRKHIGHVPGDVLIIGLFYQAVQVIGMPGP